MVEGSLRDFRSKFREIDTKYGEPKSGKAVKNPYPTLKGVACIPCTKNHLSTIAGALGEAVRFARSEGVSSGEFSVG